MATPAAAGGEVGQGVAEIHRGQPGAARHPGAHVDPYVADRHGDSVALYLASRGIGVSRRLANLRLTVMARRRSCWARVSAARRTCAPMCQLHRTYLPTNRDVSAS